jgi:hypothetical protein
MILAQFIILAYTEMILSALVACFASIKYTERAYYVRLVGWIFFVGFICSTVTLSLHHVNLGRYANLPQTFYNILNICLMSYLYYEVSYKKFGKWFLSTALVYIIFFRSISRFFKKPESTLTPSF